MHGSIPTVTIPPGTKSALVAQGWGILQVVLSRGQGVGIILAAQGAMGRKLASNQKMNIERKTDPYG